MTKNIIILKYLKISLRTIKSKDIEKLRVWKNENKYSFFYQEMILPIAQTQWYEKYITKRDNFIFIIVYKKKDIGCMGFRLIGDYIDIYNVILGEKQFSGKGLMGEALQLMCKYITKHYHREIIVKVLHNNNRAIGWYLNNGFVRFYHKVNYDVMLFQGGLSK